MSLLNYNAKEIHCKIIYVGITAAGKTSNIKWIYRHISSTEKLDVLSLPLNTKPSMFFDFLPLDAGVIRGFKTKFHLYSLPGQSLFDTSQKLLLKGVDGLVFITDSQKDKMEENRTYLTQLKNCFSKEDIDIGKIPLVVQYNKRDLDNIHSVTQMRAQLNHYNSPDFSAIAETGEGVFESLKTVLKLVITILKGGELL